MGRRTKRRIAEDKLPKIKNITGLLRLGFTRHGLQRLRERLEIKKDCTKKQLWRLLVEIRKYLNQNQAKALAIGRQRYLTFVKPCQIAVITGERGVVITVLTPEMARRRYPQLYT